MMSESGGGSMKKDDSVDEVPETMKRHRIPETVLDEQEMELESKHKRLDSWSKELESREALINLERQKLEEEKNKMNELLQEKEEALYDVEDINQVLFAKLRQSNDELQEARKELIVGLRDILSSHSRSRVNIGIKRMGEIDEKTFKNACKQIYSAEEADIKAIELCSLWQEKLKNPDWHPFRIIEDSTGNAESVLKGDDEVLVELRQVWGDEVYDAVGMALKEIQEYNPSGCYVVPELWNFKENRKATLKEAIGFIFNRLTSAKARVR